jgi:hypothetical protein
MNEINLKSSNLSLHLTENTLYTNYQNQSLNYIKENELNSGNVYYNSVQNLLSSRLLCKNAKIRIHITITLSVVLYGCETWSLRHQGRNQD